MRPHWKVALSLWLVLLLAVASTVFAQDTTGDPAPETTEEADAPPEEATQDVVDTEAPPEQAPTATPQTSGEVTTYTVQAGDNLYRIALRFGTTTTALAAANNIANASQIFVGQVLRIPSVQVSPSPTPPPTSAAPVPTATAPPAAATTYTVQRGDSLYRIALQFNTTVAELVAANNLVNPSIIYSGQVLTIPGTAGPEQPGVPTATVVPQPTGDAPGETVDANFAYGVEVFFGGQEVNSLVNQVTQLGMDWVKVRVDWRALEPEPGNINFADLDVIVDALDANDLNTLFNVTNSPTWARTSPDENGPPDDLTDFQAFVAALAQRYTGRVDAYEIWDEPNLRRNWNCERRMCDTDYLEMLTLAYSAIKLADADAIVLSAGLAPTRFNDRINAIDDRLYLATLYDNGLADVSDAIGVHPGGWANPPDARCCDQPTGVETHFESDTFYFLENLTAYRDIMVRWGDASAPMWVTKFGWGSSEDTDPPGEINVFVTYTSLAEQALYVPRAFEIGQELDYVGPMFLDNLNGCQGLPTRVEVCYAALVSPSGSPRLVFDAVQAIDKTNTEGSTVEGTSPIEAVPMATTEPELPEPQTTEEAGTQG